MKGRMVECPHGHRYRYLEELPNGWPEGAPMCPLCCKNFIYKHPTMSYIDKLKLMSKVRKVLEKTYVDSGVL